ncbi:MAG: hypothetical protein K8T20_17870 [Planctomycetes bacterium]|nr:hypothetical protein [Planctomycetota bacterium]
MGWDGGYDNMAEAEVAYEEIDPTLSVAGIDTIVSDNGTVHAFFLKSNWMTDLNGFDSPVMDLYHISRSPAGVWSEIDRISTTTVSVGTATYFGRFGQATFDSSGNVVFFYSMITVLFSPPNPAIPGDIWHMIPGSASGQLHVSMNGAAGTPVPGSGTTMGPEFGAPPLDDIVCHRGAALWLRTNKTGSIYTPTLMYVTPGMSSTVRAYSGLRGIPACGLFVDGAAVPHITFAELEPGVAYHLKHRIGVSGTDVTWASGFSPELDGCVIQDRTGVYHRFVFTPSGLAHSTSADDSSWTPSPAYSIPGATSDLHGLMVDSSNRLYVGDQMWTWEDNLGFQDSSVALPAGPASSVNASNGNFTLSIGLFGTAGHGPTAGFGLTYNSLAQSEGICGQNWSHPYLLHWQMGILTFGDGRKVVFDYDGADNAWYPRDSYGMSAKVKEIDHPYPTPSQWELELPNGAKWEFDDFGRALKFTDRDSNHLDLVYLDNPVSTRGATTVLTKVIDGYGRETLFFYDLNDMLDYVQDPGGTTYHLTYALATRQLLSIEVKPPGGTTAMRKWDFKYYGLDGAPPAAPVSLAAITGVPNLMCSYRTPAMVSTAGSADDIWIGYEPSGSSIARVNAIWDPALISGGVTSRQHQEVAYEFIETPGTPPALQTLAHFKDRRGKFWVYDVDDRRSLAFSIADPMHGAAHPTLFTYDARRNVLSATDPSGLQSVYTYIDASEGLASWVMDLVKTVQLPGDSDVTTYEYHATLNTVTKVIPVSGLLEATTLGYDGSGHVTSILRPEDSLPSTFVYTGGGKLLQSIDPEGKKVTYTYGAYGLPSQVQVDGITGAGGVPKPYKMTYNTMGQTATSEQPFGGVTTYAYNGVHEADTVTPPVDSGGGTYTYLRDGAGRVTKTTDPNGNGLEQTFDAFGRTISTKNARGDSAYVFYDEAHRVTDQTDFGGHTTHMEYDDLNRVTYSSRLVDATAEPDLYLITLMEYDDAGNLTREIVKGSDDNPPPRITIHHYDSKNLLFQTDLPGGDTEIRYGYDSKRQLLVQETWCDSGTGFEFYSGTFYFRDKQGRVVKQVEEAERFVFGVPPVGRQTVMGYNGRGMVSTRTSHLGHTSSYLYDDAGRQVLQEDPTHVQTLTEYAEDGQVRGTDILIPGHAGFQRPVTNAYDSRGQLTESHDNINPLDGTYSVYDNGGRLTVQTGPEGLYHETVYDSLNRATAQLTKKDASTTLRMDYRFDAAGNLTRRYNSPGEAAGGPSWKYEYNDANRQSNATTPLGTGHESFIRYDAVGNVTYQKDEDGNETFSSYDIKNRLTVTTYRKPPVSGVEGSGALWEEISRTYDPAGSLLAIEGSVSGIRVESSYKPDTGADPHTHELYKTVWKLTGVAWHTVVHTYDAEGRRATTTVDPGGAGSHVQEYSYDDANRVIGIKNDGVIQASFAYEAGFLLTTTLGNGNTINRTYDLKGRLEALEHATAGGTSLAKIEYAFDKRDRRTGVTYRHLGIQSTFTYTDNSWLATETHEFSIPAPAYANLEVAVFGGNLSALSTTVAVTPSPPSSSGTGLSVGYTYDERGNRLTKDVAGGTTGDSVSIFDEEDRLSSESRDGGTTTVAYAYAKRGDMTSKTVTTAGTPETSTFLTDYLARITAYSSSTSSWQYVYAPTGDRIGKQHVGLGFEDDNQWDLNSDGDVLASYHKSGATEVFDSIYVSPGMDGRQARIDGSGTASYFMNDALNSVHQVTSAGGLVSGTDFNDAWGNPIDIGLGTPGGLNNRFSYTNRERDGESGLMHYRARSYDPMTGRFVSRDPVPHSNLYPYANNCPTGFIDPSGRDEVEDAVQKAVNESVDEIAQEYAKKGKAANALGTIAHTRLTEKIEALRPTSGKNLYGAVGVKYVKGEATIVYIGGGDKKLVDIELDIVETEKATKVGDSLHGNTKRWWDMKTGLKDLSDEQFLKYSRATGAAGAAVKPTITIAELARKYANTIAVAGAIVTAFATGPKDILDAVGDQAKDPNSPWRKALQAAADGDPDTAAYWIENERDGFRGVMLDKGIKDAEGLARKLAGVIRSVRDAQALGKSLEDIIKKTKK